MPDSESELHETISLLFQAHPWHGVSPGEEAPKLVNAYIEIVPTDVVKYELDKRHGHLRLDRPQRFSSQCPTPYGFIPQTYCGDQVAKLSSEQTGIADLKGDGDPMDICVLTEKAVAHGDFLVTAKPIGGFRMIDGTECDDKVIAVLEADLAFGYIDEIDDVPKGLIDRLKHYFLSYKQIPGEGQRRVEIPEIYGRAEAFDVIKRSIDDYREKYGAPEKRFEELLRIEQK
jgi:inorganic pyrophosphatase